MGFSHSWIAVQGLDPAIALDVLGMAAARELEADDFPERLGMGQLPGGWLLVLSSDFDDAFTRLSVLASHGPAVACAMEEHVMYSEARGYSDGVEAWRVVSDCEKEDQIAVIGEPPAGFMDIRADVQRQQDAAGGKDADADYLFDVPPKVAESICGFRLGEPDPEGLRFTELRRAARSKPVDDGATGGGFFARLFGRR
jgi:hypothetical protein